MDHLSKERKYLLPNHPHQRGSVDNGGGFKQPADIRGSQALLQQDQMWQLPQPPSGGISTWWCFADVDKFDGDYDFDAEDDDNDETVFVAIQQGLGVDDDDDDDDIDDDAGHDSN